MSVNVELADLCMVLVQQLYRVTDGSLTLTQEHGAWSVTYVKYAKTPTQPDKILNAHGEAIYVIDGLFRGGHLR